MRTMEEVLSLAQAHSLEWAMPNVLAGLGLTAADLGDYRRAGGLFHECLSLAVAKGNQGMVIYGIECVARLAAQIGGTEQAARLFGAGEALRETLGFPVSPEDLAYVQPVIESLRESLATVPSPPPGQPDARCRNRRASRRPSPSAAGHWPRRHSLRLRRPRARSPNASWRCCGYSPRATATARSARRCSSAPPPRPATSPTSSTSSASTPAAKPPPSPASTGYCDAWCKVFWHGLDTNELVRRPTRG